MTPLVRRSIIWSPILIVGLLCAEPAWTQSATQQREAAVLKARAGHMAEAQAALRGMLAAGIADNGLVAMDLTTLLQQDGKSAEAADVFEKAALVDPPQYALLAATRAYRDLRRYDDAARLARQGMQRFPDETVWPLLLSLILSDDGKTTEALAILRQPAVQRSPPLERLLAEAYAWRRAGDPFKAMKIYAEAIKAGAGQPRRPRRRSRCAAGHGRAIWRGDHRRHRERHRLRLTRPLRWCVGALRCGAPIRRSASTARMRRWRNSISCWPACRRHRLKQLCAAD